MLMYLSLSCRDCSETNKGAQRASVNTINRLMGCRWGLDVVSSLLNDVKERCARCAGVEGVCDFCVTCYGRSRGHVTLP